MLDPNIRENLYNKVHAMGLPEKREAVFYRKARHGTLRTIVRRQRLIQLSEAQNHRCGYCGQKTWHPEIIDGDEVPHSRRRRATLEHIVPQTKDGGEGKHNLAMACSQCNSTRGELPLDQFIALISSNKKVPLSNTARRLQKKLEKAKSEKGKLKAAKTFRLVLIAALYIPDMFEKAYEEYEPDKKRKVREPNVHRNILGSIRRRVMRNNMDYA